jgi:hypothetical protein
MGERNTGGIGYEETGMLKTACDGAPREDPMFFSDGREKVCSGGQQNCASIFHVYLFFGTTSSHFFSGFLHSSPLSLPRRQRKRKKKTLRATKVALRCSSSVLASDTSVEVRA